MTRLGQQRMKGMIRNQRGMVYLTALGVMAILMSFGLAFLYAVQTEAKISGNEIQTLRCLYLAEGAVEHAMAKLLYGGSVYPGSGTFFVVDYTDPTPSTTYIAFMPDAKTIVGRGQVGSFNKEIKVKINDSGFANALMVDNEISFFAGSPTSSKIINGNLEINSNASDSTWWNTYLKDVVINGRVHKDYVASPNFPAPDFYKYRDFAQSGESGSVYYSGTQDWTKDTVFSDVNAVHYVDGDLYIAGPGPIDIKGTVVVKGTITIGKNQAGEDKYLGNSRLTFTPAPHKPAVIVGKDMLGNKGQIVFHPYVLSNTVFLFDGLVYTESRTEIMTFKTLTINGGLVCRPTSGFSALMYSSENGSSLAINYDPDIDPGPGYFTGGKVGVPEIVLWEGDYGSNEPH